MLGLYASGACFADFVTFPFDVAKVRLQVQGEKQKVGNGSPVYRGLFGTIRIIAANEGFRSLYNGLAAGLQRQLCFSSVRFGFYEPIKQFYRNQLYNDTSDKGIDVPVRVSAGLTSGFLCVVIAQPTDVVKIRFQAMTRGGEGQRYRNTREAYATIYNQEGLHGLWKGTTANAVRNSIVNCAEIVIYDIVKEIILRKKLMEDNIICHFTTASIAGLCATFVASPVDVIKTRYMNSPKGTYRSALDCAIKTCKEGIGAFYKGFVPSFVRISSWNIVMWITFEQLKRLAT
ncbi:dicarboxylate carrier UCP2-like [Lycorma delicatula]|uniref:dicarboxylate carrier UCP2-like n=1 Tax=Lycorma delicatula TaxID=130591 RepID=UPI003F50E811